MSRFAFEEVALQGEPEVAAFRIEGAIDDGSEPGLRAFFETAAATGKKRVVIEARRLLYMNDTGLGEFVKFCDSLNVQGGGVVLHGAGAKVHIVIEMLGLDVFFGLTPNLEAALAAVREPQAWRAAAARERTIKIAAEAASSLVEGWGDRNPLLGCWPFVRGPERQPTLEVERLEGEHPETLVTFDGPLDERAAASLAGVRARLEAEEARRVVLDLSVVGPVLRPGAEALAAFARAWCAKGRSLLLVGLPLRTSAALHRSGARAVLTCWRDLAAARRALATGAV